MKNKYKTTNYIFDPTPALSNISSLNDIEELANDIYSTNFGEAEIDYGTLRTLHNEASDIAEKAKELSYEVQNDLAVEFDKNFNFYLSY